MKIMGRTEERGAVNAWISLMLLGVLVGMAGLSLDTGYMVWTASQLQVAADAAAMAGARYCRNDPEQARLAAIECAVANVAGGTHIQLDPNNGNTPDGDIVLGRFSRDTGAFTPGASGTNAVKVVARRTGDSANGALTLLWGRIFGIETANIQRDAIAMIGGGTGAGLIVLASNERGALYISGNTTVIVNDGAIQVNSTHNQALIVQGNALTDADYINVVGDYRLNGITEDELPPIYTGAEEVPDPLADLPAPTWDPALDLGTVNMTGGESQVLTPGFYSGGISINNGSLVLTPGIYILDGAGLNITGGTFVAEGCMFYITGNGEVDIRGNGIVRILPPNPETHFYPGADVYEGISIFQDRNNTNPARIVGTSSMDLEGTYYFPNNHVDLSGNSAEFGNQFIAYTMHLSGNGTLTINYDGRFQAPGNKVFLVL